MPADLNAEIVGLRVEFQGVANLHPWVSLAIPTEGPLQVGVLVWPSAPPPEPLGKILDGNGQPIRLPRPSLEERAAYCKATGSIRFSDEHGQEIDASTEMVAKVLQDLDRWPDRLFELYGPAPWVLLPEELQLRPIVEHVKALTWRANQLLFRVLDGPNQIRDDVRQQIREWEGQCPKRGWIRWLLYAVCITGPYYRIENYPQVAATALTELAAARVQGADADQSDQWLTVSQAARVTDCDTGTITRAADDGSLKSNGRHGRDRRIDPVDLSRWKLKRADRPEPEESESAVERKLDNAIRRSKRSNA
jgi:hypothetical protein